MQRAAVGRPVRQCQAQVRGGLIGATGLQFHLAGKPAHGRQIAVGLVEHALHRRQRVVQAALALGQLGNEGAQRGAGRIELDHALEGTLGEREMLFL